MLIGIDVSPAARAQRTGTEHYTHQIVRHLLQLPQASAHVWRLYAPSTIESALFLPADAPPEVRARVDLRVLPAARVWSHRRLAQEVCAHPPDVLFVPGHVLPLTLWPRRLPASVITLHDVAFRLHPETYLLHHRLYLNLVYFDAARRASRLIAVSRATAGDLGRFYGVDPLRVRVVHEAGAPICHATPEELAAVAARYRLSRPYALFVGTIQPRKNLVRLIRAQARLLAGGAYDLDLVIAGAPGALSDEAAQEPARLGIADRVRFTGYVSEGERAALLGGARFFCYPSLYEGFGLPILEAQASGVPVLTSNNSSLPEVAGDAAILVDPLDVEALADAMLRLSQDEALRQRLIAAGRENAARFSWEKAAAETLAVLEEAAALKRGSRL